MPAKHLTCSECGEPAAGEFCNGYCQRNARRRELLDQRTDWLRVRLVQHLISESWSEAELQQRCRPDWRTQPVEFAAMDDSLLLAGLEGPDLAE